MTDLEEAAKPAVINLLQKDEDQLYVELGMRQKAYTQDLSISGSFDPVVMDDIAVLGPMDEIREFGQRLFNRWTLEAHKLLCGAEKEDVEDIQQLQNAFGIDDVAVAAFLATVLVTQLGIAAALAAVVAAIIVKRFFHPTYEEFCRAWTRHLPEA
ncbi:hypothetical protein [Methanoculleus bourgensis]|jgi:hypothetical protein|uniref:hypothetical protein n=1 Tax=Methanoculleus bourgensis TaxID=83986 RepID=UPI0022EF65BD|nr:hypothetical protein [Methanoculleus bourgensis]GLI47302.1 hypothetical protein MBOURGENBZM_20940 [Methanoculleus bourgensis]